MDEKHDNLRADLPVASIPLARGIGWGLVGGVAGTVVMDLVLMGALSLAGLPALTCFTIVGNTVASFLSGFGIGTAGGVSAGVATHYVVGPLFGVIYGAAVIRIAVFKADTLPKAVLRAVLYAEILSQPILAMAPILLNMTVVTTLKWYGGSSVMHMLWGVVAGIIVDRGLKMKKIFTLCILWISVFVFSYKDA